MSSLILASGSPRRRSVLETLGFTFTWVAPDVDEAPLTGETPEAMVERLARSKVSAVEGAGAVVVAGDTVVVLDEELVGKPTDRSDAVAILGRLQSRDHLVHTGVAVSDPTGCVETRLVTTTVGISPLSAATIEWYVDTGEPMDKAGAYGLQGIGGMFVCRVDGSHSNVIGMPVVETLSLLRRAGVDWPPNASG